MGDMKTPDFDDLLAAFDIPDMVDPKAAIESGHDDHEGHLKHNVHHEEDTHVPSAPDVGVSVIVKNVRNIDTNDHSLSDKDIHPSVGNGLHNGILTMSPSDRFGKDGGKLQRGEGHGLAVNNSTFNQFSPISSAEEFDDDDKIEVDDPLDKQNNLTCFRPNPLTGLSSKREDTTSHPLKANMVDGMSKPGTNGDFDHSKVEIKSTNNGTLSGSNVYVPPKPRKVEEQPKEVTPKSSESKEAGEQAVALNVTNLSQAKAKSSAKLSSCIAAIAALSAKKATTDSAVTEPVSTPRDSPKEAKESPKVIEKPSEQDSALELAKKMLSKQPESPCSVTSESSSKGSPLSPTGSIPVIPKVRIKTIKTSSGQIKRTVTRVLPDFDPEGLKKAGDSASIVVSSLLSSPTSSSVFSSPTRPTLPTTVVATSAGSMEVTKQMTIKPVATAFLPVSAVKTAGSQVINLKLANNTTVKATVIPAASVQSASSAILKAANAIQQQTVMVPASSLANAKLVPKTVHLTNLNLLPQSTSATDLHQVLSKSQQPIKQTVMASPPPKKVSRVQVLASSQSSVVEAFNKVLSSINPVPVYVPNLSPPSAACISLPSRGYKCLECGDSFALEKSLTQHYDRRSVRIEVTCNHCAKNLVFYNKCSLLSHARGHKDKGVVMQCSHLILKPIPVDQMILAPSVTSPSPSPASSHGCTTGNSQGKSNPTTVISAPSTAPVVAAMPLDEDASRLCRHSLKCLECNEMFQDESSLAMHYQQAAESNGQSMHGTLKTVEGPPNLGINLPLSTKPTNAMSPSPNSKEGASLNGSMEKSDKKPPSPLKKTSNGTELLKKPPSPGWTCRECDRLFTQREVFIAHMKREHGKQLKKHPCRQCDKSFSSSHSLCRHNRIKHKGVRKVYSCPHCPDASRTFTKRLMLEKHIQLIHGIKDAEGKAGTEMNNMEESVDKEQVPSPKRKLQEEVGGFHSQLSRGSTGQPMKKLKINVFKVHKCAVCNFTTDDIMHFHEHIPQHKTDGSSYQCRECGLCYTSHHSLARHLFIVHKMKEPQGLGRHNGQQENNPTPEEGPADGIPETKCKVCAKTFETEGALNTHMRTHGMAFIKSKRQSAVEK
ncbi:zinc finger protein 532 isoform X3 [Chanos chanos]|uniref:Zinc finger protein 532 n=1 Tax=Chanos chanos TaxID=29144 RepID=A0A6J2UYJ5_CHACN|nr:zinc finger protein 532 isoform X3 [Chanos chanos]